MLNIPNFPHPDEVALEFFDAMRAGYAAGGQKVTIEALPGSKVHSYDSGFYRVLDIYYKPESSYSSSGSTTIWYKGNPVWTMSYQGRYTPESTTFLKEALQRNYQHNIFAGGRGPEEFRGEGGWVYQNQVHPGSTFGKFRGREVVLKNGTMELGGYHEYQGMMLF